MPPSPGSAPAVLPRLPLHDAQVPPSGQLNLDHVAHFVPDRDAAAAALERLGFTLTPFSEQSHRLQEGGPLTPAGTGNRCAMLREGYLEFLTPFADTPVANQLRDAIARYAGVHLIAYGSGDAQADFARLDTAGCAPLPPVRLQREASAPGAKAVDGTPAELTTTVRFSVTRTPPGTMAEGRIQFCQHHTPEGVWQPRWLEHANHAVALERVFVCVADPIEAAARYARYAGLPVEPVARADGVEFIQRTARGTLHLMDAAAAAASFGVVPPALPWIAGYQLGSDDLVATRALLDRSGADMHELADTRLCVRLPPALGGLLVFAPHAAA
jgi:hypothetical protein